MEWKLNPPEYWKSVYFFVKLIGLAPFSVKNNRFHPPSFLSVLYPVFCVSSHSIILTEIFLFTLGKINVGHSTLLTKFVITLLYLTSLATICSIPIIFLFVYKKIVYLMNQLCTVSDEFKNFTIKEDHTKYFKNLFTTVVISNSILIASCLVTYSAESTSNIYITIKYTVDSFFSFNTILIFAQVLIYIKQRFVLVNETIVKMFKPFDQHVLPHGTRIFVVSRNFHEENQSGSEHLTDLQRIRKIGSLHLELCDLVKRIIDIFEIPILCISVQLFFYLVLSPYWIYFIVRDFGYYKNGAIFCIIFRMFIAIALLLIVPHASATICEQGNTTKTVLSKLWTKISAVKEVRKEYLMLSLQLMHTPVTVSAFGFMDLDYSFVFNIFCVVATYFIVIIQLAK